MSDLDILNKDLVLIKDLKVNDLNIPILHITKGEWNNIHIDNRKQKNALIDILLLKADLDLPVSYFQESISELDVADKQRIRRRISYWPQKHEEFIDEAYLELKKSIMGFNRQTENQATRLFLDHLMIGDTVEEKHKNMFFSLFMNSPELLIIDQALDILPVDLLNKMLSVISKYSNNTGMAILNFTNSDKVMNQFKAKCYKVDNNQLLHTVIN